MSYPLPTVCAAETETYTCPCSCAGEFTRHDLAYHVLALADASVARHAARYASNGMEMSGTAVREVLNTYGDMLHLALARHTPDWRNSDGLHGYAARTVRYASEEL